MAMIACSECGQSISDKAASCPNCGSPMRVAQKSIDETPGSKGRGLAGILLLVLFLWGLGTTAWLIHSNRRGVTNNSMGRAQTGENESTPVASRSVAAEASVPDARATLTSATAASVPYATTADKLALAFNENAVAAQQEINGRRVRLSGSVTAIEEDADSHPVVKLKTSLNGAAQLTLNDDQKGAAAQVVRGQKVEVDCDLIRQVAGLPQGSGCTLVPQATDTNPAYLAVAYAKDAAHVPLFIVGPVAMTACLAHLDQIAGQLRAKGNPVSKTCSPTAQDNIRVGCRLDSMMESLPDIPAAHVWKYDCIAEPAPGRKPRDITIARRQASTSVSAVPLAEAPTSSAVIDAPVAIPYVREEPTPVPEEAASVPVTVPTVPAAAPAIPAALPAALPAAVTPEPQITPPQVPADLASVNSSDPKAAVKIQSYCNDLTAAAANRDAVASGCRRDEVAAWSRLVAQNEYATLDEGSRRKCEQPPFPDSYVAKEACAKYQLRK